MYPLTELQEIGLEGELWAKKQLEARGYSVEMPANFSYPGTDLIVNGTLPVEVKIANPKPRWLKLNDGLYKAYPRWKWNVNSVTNEDKIVILIAKTKSANFAFICPSALFVDRSMVEITSYPPDYTGYISKHLNNWKAVDYLLKQRYQDAQQLDLFAEYREVSEVI